MKEFIVSTVFSAVVGGTVGSVVSYFFWKLKFKTQLKVNFYREVLEKLVCPFYFWLLHGKIRAEDRNLTTDVPEDQRDMLIVYNEGEDEQVINVLKKYLHLSSADQKLFAQIKEFLKCREFNFKLLETRQKMFKIYQAMETIFHDYSAKYKSLIEG